MLLLARSKIAERRQHLVRFIVLVMMDQAAQIRVVFPPHNEEFDRRRRNERTQAVTAFVHLAASDSVSIDGKADVLAAGKGDQSPNSLNWIF